MKRELALVSILLLALQLQYITAECPNYVQYNTTFVPACGAEDIMVVWPNYENSTTFYKCRGIRNAVLMSCDADYHFCYVRQSCGPCANYLPPIECSRLPTETSPNCIPIEAGTPTPAPNTTTTNSIPTPNVPTTTTTISIPTPNVPTTTTTISIPTPGAPTTTTPDLTTTTQTTTTTTTIALPVPPSPPTGSEDIPPPPSPVTVNPDIPGPPTPAATPPSVQATPPIISP